MNKIRSTDRARNLAVYTIANRQAARAGQPQSIIPAGADSSVYDELVLSVEGPKVIIYNGGMSADELLALAGLPLPSGFTPTSVPASPQPVAASPITGSYDTAPRSDEDPFA